MALRELGTVILLYMTMVIFVTRDRTWIQFYPLPKIVNSRRSSKFTPFHAKMEFLLEVNSHSRLKCKHKLLSKSQVNLRMYYFTPFSMPMKLPMCCPSVRLVIIYIEYHIRLIIVIDHRNLKYGVVGMKRYDDVCIEFML